MPVCLCRVRVLEADCNEHHPTICLPVSMLLSFTISVSIYHIFLQAEAPAAPRYDMLSPSFPASCTKHGRAPPPDPYERKKYGPHGTQRLGQSRCTRPRRESPLMATTFCHHNKRGVDYMCRCFCNYHSKYKVGTDWH